MYVYKYKYNAVALCVFGGILPVPAGRSARIRLLLALPEMPVFLCFAVASRFSGGFIRLDRPDWLAKRMPSRYVIDKERRLVIRTGWDRSATRRYWHIETV
ncbi:MAG TPA: hypothetical protein VMG82_24400 [Candidatus Sulfotelmatobacter sp.]|nr:hypothetical protein [Candidatus Sulfotelmatobacter sp.]